MTLTRFASLALLSAIAGCGTSTSESETFRLEVDDGDSAIEMQAGETRSIQIVVIGASEPVTITADLPPFAALTGTLLTISPARTDAGAYSLAITATAGSLSHTVILNVTVHLQNTPPRAGFIGTWALLADDDGLRRFETCPGPYCTLLEGSSLLSVVCDDELDEVTVALEVIPQGDTFSGQPTHSGSGRGIAGTAAKCEGNGSSFGEGCTCVKIPLGLEPDRTYVFAMKVTDELGAVASPSGHAFYYPEGWFRSNLWQFDQGPCTTHECACRPAGTFCWGPAYGTECCSGACTDQSTCS